MFVKQTQDEFIAKSKEIFHTLDYSKVKYIDSKTNIILICQIHQEEFLVSPGSHLSYKRGCPYCNGHFLHFIDFKKRANEIHNNKYDYSKSVWGGVKNKIEIICKLHGSFNQLPDKHLNSKQGCKICANKHNKSKEYYINLANKIHNKFYDYSLVEFVKPSEKVIIICPKHGKFYQLFNNHYRGAKCQQCAFENSRISNEEIIMRAIEKHGNRYDYSKTNYVKSSQKIEITCRKHGSFWQEPHLHINGANCPKCQGSVSNKEQLWLDSLNISKENRNITLKINNKNFRVDAFDPKTNTIYEFYGDYWHGNPEVYRDNYIINFKNKCSFQELYNKTILREKELCNAGYKIISIWEKDFKNLDKK